MVAVPIDSNFLNRAYGSETLQFVSPFQKFLVKDYEDFVFSGCLLDKKDPVTEWKKIHQHQEKICEFLNRVSKIHILGEDTDLLLSVKNRKWINCSGKLNMLFDEKMGGTIHMALGASIPESGGLNKSAIHWDIVKDMKKDGEIYADNQLFYKNGKFLMK